MELIDAPLNAWIKTRAVVVATSADVACPEKNHAG